MAFHIPRAPLALPVSRIDAPWSTNSASSRSNRDFIEPQFHRTVEVSHVAFEIRFQEPQHDKLGTEAQAGFAPVR